MKYLFNPALVVFGVIFWSFAGSFVDSHFSDKNTAIAIFGAMVSLWGVVQWELMKKGWELFYG